jgi:predicted GNAT family N-acyltransferase
MKQVNGRTFELRKAKSQELYDLRWRILRQGLPIEEAMFDGDDAETSLHFAAVEHGVDRVVCCATFHLNQWEGKPAYQLRGMATESDCRGFGLGAGVLAIAEQEILRVTPIRLLWCNARTPALEFYKKQGWEVRSELFHIPTAGPHVKMTKKLDAST